MSAKMEEKNREYYACCSFGKDSIATILLALIHNEPLDGVVFTEVMFDNGRGISGEEPEHIEWIYNTAIPRLKELGVKNIYVLRNTKDDYISEFNHIKTKSKIPERNGMKQGFPLSGMCNINKKCKLKPMTDFFKQHKDCIQYIGIAIDEPKRLERIHKKPNKVSLLEKYQYTEKDAYRLCEQYNLISPIYNTGTRGGCWFCPYKTYNGLACIKRNHPELWNELSILAEDRLAIGGFKFGELFQDVDRKVDGIINKV